jgi:ABC-type transport system involved in multi-copper enzyme maturation permease subunit
MSRADLVLYRRMRGIFWGLLVVGMVILPTLMILGLAIPAHAGMFPDQFVAENLEATKLFSSGFSVAAAIGSIAAVVLGATAGSVDHQRGVLRDLVLTGRPRWRIVVGRLLGAFAWLVGALLVAFAISLAGGALLSPLEPALDMEEVTRFALQVLPGIALSIPLAAGVALLIGSRGPAIAVYFVVALVIDNVLSVIPKLGEWWREVSLTQSNERLGSWIADTPSFSEQELWQAVVVLAGWAIIPFVAGVVRLTRRDL